MKHFATIELHVDDAGDVHALVCEPRGVGMYCTNLAFATVDAALNDVSPMVARLRPRRLIAGATPAGDIT